MRILLVLLFCVQSACGAERYFASGVRFGSVLWQYQEDDNGQQIYAPPVPNGELDVTIGDDIITVHRSRFLFEGQVNYDGLLVVNYDSGPITTFELEGKDLQIFVDLDIKDVTFPRFPEFFWDSGKPKQLESEPIDVSAIRIFGTYGDIDFDLQLAGEHPFPNLNRYRLEVEFDEHGALTVFEDWYKLRAFPFALNLGNGISLGPLINVRAGGEGGWRDRGILGYTDIQRVPSLEELAVLLPGDTDMDGEVEFSDFLKLSSKFGGRGTWGHGDFNGDFNVDFGDFLILSSNYGRVRTVSAVVPEPGLAVLLLPAVMFLRRRH